MARSSANGKFQFSESVVAYFNSKEIKSAVNFLLADRIAYVAETVEWGRLDDFYDACLAARQTQIEFAKDMARLWNAVWSGFPDDWTPLPPNPGDEELTLDPAVRFEQEYFERHFTFSHGKTITLWVVTGPEGSELDQIAMGFDVRQGRKHFIKNHRNAIDNRLRGWKFEDGAMRLSYRGPSANGLDLRPFKEDASGVFDLISTIDWDS